ncbi:MAG: hypothetical protein ABGX16_19135, partial [Pirellulales bacterium]
VLQFLFTVVVRKVYAAAKRPVTASQVEISSSSATATAEGLRFLHSAEVHLNQDAIVKPLAMHIMHW